MEHWSSRLGFILAAIGAAVGLGNIWRFPAVVGQNGGGAYLVPYIISFFALALPLMVLEIAVGRRFDGDVVTVFRRLRRGGGPVGWLIVATVLLVASYYLVITGWTLAFFVAAVLGDIPTFAAFTAGLLPVIAFAAATVVAGGVLSLGVKAGIERMVTLLVPVIFLTLGGLVVYAATLPGFGDGLRYFLTPDPAALTTPGVWGAALGQAFFSLSVGQGIMLTLGSYLDEGVDIGRTAGLIGMADFTVAFLSGAVIFALVFSFGLAPTGGAELAFTTLPGAFAAMPFGGVVAVLFFGVLFAAALTSAVTMLEVGVGRVVRRRVWCRTRAAGAVTGAVLVAGVPSVLSYSGAGFTVLDIRFLDLLDESVGSVGLLFTAFLITVVVARAVDRDTLRAAIGPSARYVLPVTSRVLPVVLAVLLGVRLATTAPGAWQVLPELGSGLSLVAGLVAAVFVLVAVRQQTTL